MSGLDWADGAYELTASPLAPAAEVLLDALVPAPGERLLDVGCGTGNLTLAASGRGTRVTAVDPAAGLLDRAQMRPGADAISWQVMEAGRLPVQEDAFDVVAACFSVIFAPDARLAAAELCRACAPGGRLGYTAWIPEGGIAKAGRLVKDALAPGRQPTPWFEAGTAAELLGGAVTVKRHELAFTADSAEAWLAEQEEYHPVWRLAVRSLPADVWRRIRAESIATLEAHNMEAAGFRVMSPYVVTTASLDELGRDLIGEQIVAGYRRIPQGTPDEWGDLEALGRASTAAAMARLDAEERAAGFDPW